MGRVKSTFATGAKAAAKRSDLSGQRHGVRAVMARLASERDSERARRGQLEQRVEELERRSTELEARLEEISRGLQVVVT